MYVYIDWDCIGKYLILKEVCVLCRGCRESGENMLDNIYYELFLVLKQIIVFMVYFSFYYRIINNYIYWIILNKVNLCVVYVYCVIKNYCGLIDYNVGGILNNLV